MMHLPIHSEFDVKYGLIFFTFSYSFIIEIHLPKQNTNPSNTFHFKNSQLLQNRFIKNKIEIEM